MTIALESTSVELTYSWLKSEIAAWSHRSDLTDRIPGFIVLAEKRIATRLRSRIQEQAGTITTTSGAATASLPTTLLGVQAMSIDAESATLDYLPPEQFRQDFPDSSYTGAPRAYTTVGGTVYFGPTPDAAYTVSVMYRGSIATLNDDAPTNDLLTKWPNLYLAAAMLEVADFVSNDKMEAKWTVRFNEAIEGVNLVDQHAGGLMRVRTDVRN
jgi:hypothetical protein